MRSTLRTRGVLPADLDDLTQDTVLGAWRSMEAGRFRPSPELSPADALRIWLTGVASRQAQRGDHGRPRRRIGHGERPRPWAIGS
ncbi:hypothetical protein WMF04_32970 [Sorangium sp. So ce260]|uniref:hypothetical protein n=1 Tax=Sorangium sp. So ce260 TaxID=3133291 RepID=UPI003F5FCB19